MSNVLKRYASGYEQYKFPKREFYARHYRKGETPRRYVNAKMIDGVWHFEIEHSFSMGLSIERARVYDYPYPKEGYITFNLNKPSAPFMVVRTFNNVGKFDWRNWEIVHKKVIE